MTIKTLIVDDEPLARERIRTILGNYPEFTITGECSDGFEAIRRITNDKPDLLFLDVQMPEMDGISVLKALKPDQIPVTIFITAYEDYALQAFEVHAADYLLKPFDKVRFIKAIEWAKEQISPKSMHSSKQTDNTTDHNDDDSKHGSQMNRIMIKSNGRVNLIKVSDIDWIEASGNYLRLHVGDKVHLIRETMAKMEDKLNDEQFMRIHRSTIVNIDRIKELQPWFHGEYEVHLHNGTRLTMSRGYKDKLHGFIRR